ncbi:MAG: GNAT family N-acetyltransferase [Alphaproteobacteria bacterium]|nr:GNAT family N-acetyltransferase [Alphaproteobacteria bacterium]
MQGNLIYTTVSLEAVNAANWHEVNAVRLAPEQASFISSPGYTLLQISMESVWILLGIRLTDLAHPDGKIVGYAGLIPDPTKPDILWVHRLGIDQNYQNRHIGTAAACILGEAAIRSGFREARSGIEESNEHMHGLHKKFNAQRGIALDDLATDIVVGDEQLCTVDRGDTDLSSILASLQEKGIGVQFLQALPQPGFIPLPVPEDLNPSGFQAPMPGPRGL